MLRGSLVWPGWGTQNPPRTTSCEFELQSFARVIVILKPSGSWAVKP